MTYNTIHNHINIAKELAKTWNPETDPNVTEEERSKWNKDSQGNWYLNE